MYVGSLHLTFYSGGNWHVERLNCWPLSTSFYLMALFVFSLDLWLSSIYTSSCLCSAPPPHYDHIWVSGQIKSSLGMMLLKVQRWIRTEGNVIGVNFFFFLIAFYLSAYCILPHALLSHLILWQPQWDEWCLPCIVLDFVTLSVRCEDRPEVCLSIYLSLKEELYQRSIEVRMQTQVLLGCVWVSTSFILWTRWVNCH